MLDSLEAEMYENNMEVESEVCSDHCSAEYRWDVAQYWDGLLLLVLACLILFSHLGSPLLEPDESRYAEIPRLMLRSGNWMTPQLQGKPYNDKPPLVYWLIAGSYALFGISIEAARLVPAASGLLTLVIVYLWSRRYLGRSAANATVLILLSMLGFVAFMRMLLLDGVLTFMVVGSLLTGHHALSERRHPGWWLISATLCGLGVLTKGPVAMVLVTPCLFALRWLDRRTTPMRFLDAVRYGIVVMALAAPWYTVMMVTNEGFGSEHFLRHHLQRFLDPAHHERPIWFYIPSLILELLPWPLLLLAVVPRWRTWTGTERFLVFFSALCFLFFSVARAKLPTYLLPMLPTLAMLFGKQLLISAADVATEKRLRWSVLLIVMGMLLAVAFRSHAYHWIFHEGEPGVDVLALAVMLIIALALLIMTIWKVQLTGMYREGIIILAAFVGTIFMIQHTIPDFARYASVVEPCQQLIELAEREGIPYVAHRNSWDAVSFMLNRDELEVFSSREMPAFWNWIQTQGRCMIWMRDYESRIEAFTKTLPGGIEVEHTYDLGHVQAIILRRAMTAEIQTK